MHRWLQLSLLQLAAAEIERIERVDSEQFHIRLAIVFNIVLAFSVRRQLQIYHAAAHQYLYQ